MAYIPGDNKVICDRCGRQRLASECRFQWNNLFVCVDTCWEPRHPQEFVHAVLDDQRVAVVRPDIESSIGETTLSSAASKDATSIEVTSATGISDRDSIGITLDNGTVHWTFSNGDPSGTTVTLGSYLPWDAASGNTVYVPSINNWTYATATSFTATEL